MASQMSRLLRLRSLASGARKASEGAAAGPHRVPVHGRAPPRSPRGRADARRPAASPRTATARPRCRAPASAQKRAEAVVGPEPTPGPRGPVPGGLTRPAAGVEAGDPAAAPLPSMPSAGPAALAGRSRRAPRPRRPPPPRPPRARPLGPDDAPRPAALLVRLPGPVQTTPLPDLDPPEPAHGSTGLPRTAVSAQGSVFSPAAEARGRKKVDLS